jgi:hypothetical protein
MPAPEDIPPEAEVCRLLDYPRTYDGAGKGLIWEKIFEFPGGDHESMVWTKYATAPDGVHEKGCAREASKRHVKPEFRYEGYILTTAAQITGILTAAGHRFALRHMPDEGLHHAGIFYQVAPGPFTKPHKVELKYALSKVFGARVPHRCPEPT